MSNILFDIIAAAAAIAAVISLIYTAKRNSVHDSSNDGRESGIILTEIGYIKSSVDDVKHNQSEYNALQRELIERVGRIDESVKSAHHRIDGLEDRIERK